MGRTLVRSNELETYTYIQAVTILHSTRLIYDNRVNHNATSRSTFTLLREPALIGSLACGNRLAASEHSLQELLIELVYDPVYQPLEFILDSTASRRSRALEVN